MDIVQLTHLNDDFDSHWGNNGYVTKKVLDVKIAGHAGEIVIEITQADRPYKKKYKLTPGQLVHLNKLIKRGFSFGAFENNELLGVMIGDIRGWNNTFYIENI